MFFFKEEQLIQSATLPLQQMLINMPQPPEHLFHRTLITSYFCPLNIAKFLRTAQNTSRSNHLLMFFKIGVLKSFANFTGKHLCWSPLLKNIRLKACNFIKKTTGQLFFPAKFAKFLRASFFCRIPMVTASAPPVAASVFFKNSDSN